jgi:hypothetical protein
MTRRRCILLSAAVLAACVGIALGVLAMLLPSRGITKARLDRIQNGMTLAEVEQVFGRPADDEWVSPVSDKQVWKYWERDENSIGVAGVCFFEKRVVDTTWTGEETFLDKFRSWLRLPK